MTDIVPEVPALVAVLPRLTTPLYSSSAQLAVVPPEILTLNDVEATEPLAVVDHISDLTEVLLFVAAWKVQTDPLSVIELMEEVVLPKAQTATTVLPSPLW